ncbi:glycosyltransferase family 2 protein [Methylovorus sp. SPW-M1]
MLNADFLVSVIIPTYNRYDSTCRAVKSVLNQTYKNIEIIVVDDRSKDDSYERLGHFFKDYNQQVILIQNPENSGAATGRNNGVKLAKGEFVAFLDSDDEWFPKKLEVQLQKHLEREVSNQPIISYATAKLEYPINGHKQNPVRNLKSGEKLEEYIFLDNQDVQTSGWLMRKELFNRIKFTDKLPRHQDLDFVFRAQAQGVSFYLPVLDPLYARGHGDKNQHVGIIKDDGFTLKWLKSVELLILPRAYHYFIMDNIFPLVLNRSVKGAFILLFEAAISGQFFLGKFKYLVIKVIKNLFNTR